MMIWSRSITFRLILISTVGLIILVVNSAVNVAQINSVKNSAREMRGVWMRKDDQRAELQFLALQYHTTTIRKVVAVVAVDETENRDLDSESTEMHASIPEAFGRYRALVGSSRERTLWEACETRWHAYLAAREPIIAALKRGDRAGARDAIAPAPATGRRVRRAVGSRQVQC
jgi:methyl-accepting chemotaxis protein